MVLAADGRIAAFRATDAAPGRFSPVGCEAILRVGRSLAACFASFLGGIRMIFWTLRCCIALAVLGGTGLAWGSRECQGQAAEAAVAAPQTYQGEGWAISVPSTWKRDTAIRPPAVLKLKSEGADGFPQLDGMLRPLVASIRVHVLPPEAGRVDIVVDHWKKYLQTLDGYALLGEIQTAEVSLAGGVSGTRVSAMLASKKDPAFLSLQQTVVAANKERKVIVVQGAIDYHRAAAQFLQSTGLGPLMLACVESLAVDEAPIDAAKLQAPYQRFRWRAADAIVKTLEADKLARANEATRAAALFGEALALSDEVTAAHQKLAWLLASARDPRVFSPVRALPHAEKAVAQTAMLDIESLDTLALCYLKTGQPKKAAELFRAALAKDPDNSALRERLSLYD